MKPWRKTLLLYLNSSTIHGFKYISRAKGSLNKVLWSTVVIFVFVLASCLIYKSLSEAAVNPITTYVKTVHVSDVPFPAVTVSAEQPVRPQGLMSHILDRFCFDKAGRSPSYLFTGNVDDNQCTGQNSTFLLRRDFQAIIEQVKLSLYS